MGDHQLRQLERDWKQNPTNENAAAYMAEMSRSGEVDYSAWLRFLGGHWTLDAPTECGVYHRANRQGDPITPQILIFDSNGKRMAIAGGAWHRWAYGAEHGAEPSEVWKGYWWSEPSPELPKVQDLTKGEDDGN